MKMTLKRFVVFAICITALTLGAKIAIYAVFRESNCMKRWLDSSSVDSIQTLTISQKNSIYTIDEFASISMLNSSVRTNTGSRYPSFDTMYGPCFAEFLFTNRVKYRARIFISNDYSFLCVEFSDPFDVEPIIYIISLESMSDKMLDVLKLCR